MKPTNYANISSYMKYAGSKKNILQQTINLIGGGDSPFYDVFGGSGVVSLAMTTACPDRKIYLNDGSKPLINLHLNVIEDWQGVFYPAQQMFHEFLALERGSERQKLYYNTKRQEFNNLSVGKRAASLLLFLNRACFNGLYRFSSNGFNVPCGSYDKIYEPTKELRYFSQQMSGVVFSDQDYIKFMMSVEDGSTIYCDPPYATDKGLTTFDYTADKFTASHQRNLVEVAKTLAETKGCRVLIANHNNSFTKELYKDADIHYISVKRTISSNGDRQDAKELIAIYG